MKQKNCYHMFDDTFVTTQYPSGEFHTSLIPGELDPDYGDIVVEHHVRDFNGLGALLSADICAGLNGIHIKWFVPFFPFARDDRRNTRFDGFELGVALSMVRDIDITILDPHSDVAGMLNHIPQSVVVEAFKDTDAFVSDPVVIIPDDGATKKAHTWLNGTDYVQAHKVRDTKTGKLSGFSLDSDDLGYRPCIIVDDICDGGGTFLGLAELLQKNNCGPLTLAVSHGLFTKGLKELSKQFDGNVYALGGFEGASPYAHILPFYTVYEKYQESLEL